MNKLEPLTQHELRKMDGETVWCEELNCNITLHVPKEGYIAATTQFSGGYDEYFKVSGEHYTMYIENPYDDEEQKESDYNKILNKIGIAACMEQGAEECAELAQALMKAARIIRNENPTPVKMQDALAKIKEETADVLNCIHVMEIDFDLNTKEIEKNKIDRWMKRLGV